MIPLAIHNPNALRLLRGKIANAFAKFRLRIRVAQLHARQARATIHKMYVRIIKPRQHPLAAQLNNVGRRSSPLHYLFRRPHTYNPVATNRDRFRLWLLWILRPDLAAHQHRVRKGLRYQHGRRSAKKNEQANVLNTAFYVHGSQP